MTGASTIELSNVQHHVDSFDDDVDDNNNDDEDGMDYKSNDDDDLLLNPLVSTHTHLKNPTKVLLVDNGDDDDDDDAHGAAPPGSASSTQVVINIVISFVGAGLLGIPNAFAQSGWLLGGIALLSVSTLNVYAMLCLPQVQRVLMERQGKNGGGAAQQNIHSYGDLGRAIMGPHGERLVHVCLGISQAGFATAYIIFIAANLYSIAQMKRWMVCTACIPGLALLVQFRDLKSLSPFSLLANTANFCALTAVLLQDYESYQESHNDTIQMVQFNGLLYVIAITIYSMEGVGLVLSLKASCQQPSQFGWLLSVTIAIISLFMVVFGTAGYEAFGDSTIAPITLNLTSHWSATFVKCALCLGLYLTYPIMMFPIWNIVEVHVQGSKSRKLLRAGVVVLSALIAYSVPNFGVFLSLVGSSICTLLGFVFPTYFHLKVMGKELSWWQWILDVCLFVGGILFGILGTYHSIVAMLKGEPLEGGE
jgi:proton-coupled amino acid transporter